MDYKEVARIISTKDGSFAAKQLRELKPITHGHSGRVNGLIAQYVFEQEEERNWILPTPLLRAAYQVLSEEVWSREDLLDALPDAALLSVFAPGKDAAFTDEDLLDALPGFDIPLAMSLGVLRRNMFGKLYVPDPA